MFKKLLIGLLATGLMFSAGAAEAGKYRHGYYAGHNYGHSRNYRHGYRHGYRHKRKHIGKYVAGAVLLGAILHSASQSSNKRYYRDRRYSDRRRYERDRYYGERDRYRDERSSWYHYTEDGECFKVRHNRYGEEVFTEVNRRYCE